MLKEQVFCLRDLWLLAFDFLLLVYLSITPQSSTRARIPSHTNTRTYTHLHFFTSHPYLMHSLHSSKLDFNGLKKLVKPLSFTLSLSHLLSSFLSLSLEVSLSDKHAHTHIDTHILHTFLKSVRGECMCVLCVLIPFLSTSQSQIVLLSYSFFSLSLPINPSI